MSPVIVVLLECFFSSDLLSKRGIAALGVLLSPFFVHTNTSLLWDTYIFVCPISRTHLGYPPMELSSWRYSCYFCRMHVNTTSRTNDMRNSFSLATLHFSTWDYSLRPSNIELVY
ncbi:hypothetical protein CSKR_200587 [Clonorchis sinensis]|uniref:Uncharacterized protein n=1 Tax=Clonorchis sinensis TaxID=79923 RepID=A0A8T1MGD6_CLOSI|nr:hypothetical protein CSKR_200587 [Clonorchis sinensis]